MEQRAGGESPYSKTETNEEKRETGNEQERGKKSKRTIVRLVDETEAFIINKVKKMFSVVEVKYYGDIDKE